MKTIHYLVLTRIYGPLLLLSALIIALSLMIGSGRTAEPPVGQNREMAVIAEADEVIE